MSNRPPTKTYNITWTYKNNKSLTSTKETEEMFEYFTIEKIMETQLLK